MVKWMCDAGYSMTGVRDLDLLLMCLQNGSRSCSGACWRARPTLAEAGARPLAPATAHIITTSRNLVSKTAMAVSRGLCVISGCDGRCGWSYLLCGCVVVGVGGVCGGCLGLFHAHHHHLGHELLGVVLCGLGVLVAVAPSATGHHVVARTVLHTHRGR